VADVSDVKKVVEGYVISLSCSICSEHLFTFKGGQEGVDREWFPEDGPSGIDLPVGGGVPKGRYILKEKDVPNFEAAVEGKNDPGFGSPLACNATDHCPGYADLAPLERARQLITLEPREEE
jgi:hypothetical protein